MARTGRPSTRPKRPLDRTRPLWDRQARETDPAWAGFLIYREMGLERSLSKASAKANKSLRVFTEWSTEWSWQERCRAYEAEKDRQIQEAAKAKRIAAVEAMVDRHISIASDFQRLGQVELRRIMHKVGADAADPDFKLPAELTVDQLRILITEGIRLERLNRGEPETVGETRVAASGEAFADLIRKAMSRRGG